MTPHTLGMAIRSAVIDDALEIARLLTVLGHPTSTADIQTRWEAWSATGSHALVATEGESRLVGLATLHVMRVLHRAYPVGRVTALVVAADRRRTGIGRTLLEASEEALRHAGCGMLEITSHMRHAEAHDFYRKFGYEQTGPRFVKVTK